jgi:hypothetical protein
MIEHRCPAWSGRHKGCTKGRSATRTVAKLFLGLGTGLSRQLDQANTVARLIQDYQRRLSDHSFNGLSEIGGNIG